MDMDAVSILTPTGDRETSLRLLCDFLRRQTFTGTVQWVIVDDGEIPWRVDPHLAAPPAAAAFELTYVRRREPDVTGGSLNRNLLYALRNARHDKLVIMEDDDWYGPKYVAALAARLDRYQLVGEGEARYYNVRQRRWKQLANRDRASLCQTGFRRDILPQVEQCCRSGDPFIDMRLWRLPVRRHVAPAQGLSIGIKGMPGRSGYGIGHRPPADFRHDGSLVQLQRWVGADAALYAPYWEKPIRSWWAWLRTHSHEARWCLIGKGPSAAAAVGYDWTGWRTLGLNHVCRELPVTVTHVIDGEVLDELGTALAERSEFVVMPWHPHVRSRPTARTLPEFVADSPVLESLRAEGRLLSYHCGLHGEFRTRPDGEPAVGVRYFSSEAAANLLLGGGVRQIATLGIDGGSSYAPQFADLPTLRNGRSSFDAQFTELDRVAKLHRARLVPLSGSAAAVHSGSGSPPVAFLHVPKTGGMSLKAALESQYEHRHSLYGAATEEADPWPELVCGHVSASELLSRYPAAWLLTCVRHPIDRLVSQWRFWCARVEESLTADAPFADVNLVRFARERPTVEAFAEWYPGTLQRMVDVPVERFNWVLDHARLAEQWPLLLQRLGVSVTPLPVVNATPTAVVQPAFSRRRLETKLADEIDLYEALLEQGRKCRAEPA